MSRVSFGEATSYGFSLIGYFLLVILVGGGLILLGGIIGLSGLGTDEADVYFMLGIMVTAFGWLVIVAGSYGAFYKVIADGVGRGNRVNIPTSNLKVY